MTHKETHGDACQCHSCDGPRLTLLAVFHARYQARRLAASLAADGITAYVELGPQGFEVYTLQAAPITRVSSRAMVV